MITAIQMDSSYSTRSGIVSKASETGSTVGRSAARMSRITNAILRFFRSRAELRTRRRTSPSTTIGSWKASPPASSSSETNE